MCSRAALKLEQFGFSADVFVVNIADWATIETTRTTSGNFDLGAPVDRHSRGTGNAGRHVLPDRTRDRQSTG